MRGAATITLVLGLTAALVPGLDSVPESAAATSHLETVTHDVGTLVTRRDTPLVRRRARGVVAERAGRIPDRARQQHELPDPAGPGKIFGGDDREPVEQTDLFPWSTVAKVISTFPDGVVAEGSAVMVGRAEALTAAHVVYDDRHGGWADDVEVIPGFDRGVRPFGSYVASDLRSFAGFIDDGDFAYDFALLELDGNAGDDTGWMGIASRSDGELLADLMNTAGYPGDLENGEGMWYAADFATDVDAGSIYLRGTLDAARGQSGSGVWMRSGDDRFVVGVVSTEIRSSNVAARISDDVFDALDEWLGGAPASSDPPPDTLPPAGTDFWQLVQVPTKLHARLVPNDEVRYRFVIDEPLAKMKLRLRGARFRGFALVVRPDGSTFKLLPRLWYKTIENQPQLGEWLVLVKNRPDAGRSRRFKLNIKIK